MQVKITRINKEYEDLPLPHYVTAGSAGLDIYAAITESLIIDPFSTVLVPTNLAIELENGYECQVRSRSGLAIKHGIFALNAPGTIDSDYRGEIKVILSNFNKESFRIERGDRIAQLVFTRYEKADLIEVNELQETERGAGGFGSTGK